MLAPNGYNQKVVAGDLAYDAREARAAVGKEDFRLAVTAGIKERLAGHR